VALLDNGDLVSVDLDTLVSMTLMTAPLVIPTDLTTVGGFAGLTHVPWAP
jgi:hypothetical protein